MIAPGTALREGIHELGLTGSISARKPTLDDVYLSLSGDSLAAAA